MSRRKKHEEHENEERWLLTYADLITLLMVFFVVMYALSNVDKQKFRALAISLRTEFGTPALGPVSGGNVAPGNTMLPSGTEGREHSRRQGKTKTEKIDALKTRMKQLKSDLDALVKGSGLEKSINVTLDPSGHKVSMGLSDSLLFGVGSADLTQAAQDLVAKIGTVLADKNYTINVEGHTDNVPIRSARYSSNFQLSTDRAVNVVSYMINTTGIPGSRLSASGYAEHHPIASNDTEEGRAKNRRVEFVIHDPDEEKILTSDEEPAAEAAPSDAAGGATSPALDSTTPSPSAVTEEATGASPAEPAAR